MRCVFDLLRAQLEQLAQFAQGHVETRCVERSCVPEGNLLRTRPRREDEAAESIAVVKVLANERECALREDLGGISVFG